MHSSLPTSFLLSFAPSFYLCYNLSCFPPHLLGPSLIHSSSFFSPFPPPPPSSLPSSLSEIDKIPLEVTPSNHCEPPNTVVFPCHRRRALLATPFMLMTSDHHLDPYKSLYFESRPHSDTAPSLGPPLQAPVRSTICPGVSLPSKTLPSTSIHAAI